MYMEWKATGNSPSLALLKARPGLISNKRVRHYFRTFYETAVVQYLSTLVRGKRRQFQLLPGKVPGMKAVDICIRMAHALDQHQLA